MGRLAHASSRARGLVTRLPSDPLIRNNVVYLAGTVAAGAFGYVFHFIVGRLLGPASYSIVASAIAALYLLTLPSLVVQTVSMRFTSVLAARDDLAGLRHLLVRLTFINLMIGALLALALLAGGQHAARFLQLPSQDVVIVLAFAAALGVLVAANRGVLQGLRRFAALSTNLVTDMAARVAVGAALIAAGLSVLGALLGVLFGPALAYGQSLLLLRSLRGSPGRVAVTPGAIGRYAVPASVAVMGVTYLFNVDVLLAKHYLSPPAAGVYAAASVLGRIVYFLGLTIAGVMFPEVATLHARDQSHFHVVDRSLLFLGTVAVMLTGTYVAVPGLVAIPFGASFQAVYPYLGLFALALSLLALANLLVNYFLSVNSSRFVLPLLAACMLETVLIIAFHDGPGRIVSMVLVTCCLLLLVLAAFYLMERFDRRPRLFPRQ